MSLTIKTVGRGRRVVAGSLIALTALTLTACQSGTDASSRPSSADAAAQSQPNTAQQSHPAKPSGNSAGATNAGQANASAMTASDRCTTTDMSLRLGRTDIGAGNIRVPLIFTNKGKKACSLRGFPGVSLTQRDGSAIGKPASREGGAGGSVRLQPGQSAHAVLHTVNDGVSDTPCWKNSQNVSVYPPGSKESMTTSSGGLRVCGGTFTVTTVEAGSLG
ncbi:DUF4232 domain-containing protein [Streptomyces inhibens]|uniref:DUF4232 domain-containing protein n=1 Tax=Streptomyces inhibens TaxID=2293571 RepID=UPI001EE6DAC5|nr:DUF4232 domain-containing protein [Streptomyces inhibens]UKY47989.1 DUF4232 domain-containing protein [Streptomyces inhibens]